MNKGRDLSVVRIRTEKIRNESWVKLSNYHNDLIRITENGGPENERDKDIIFLAALVACQHLTVNMAEDKLYDLPVDCTCCKCGNPEDLCTCDVSLKDIEV